MVPQVDTGLILGRDFHDAEGIAVHVSGAFLSFMGPLGMSHIFSPKSGRQTSGDN
jgi:hypothetical protein